MSSLLFLFSALAFVAALFIGKALPRVPLILYFFGVLPIALRAFVRELALDAGLVVLAGAIAWLAGLLWVRAGAAVVQD